MNNLLILTVLLQLTLIVISMFTSKNIRKACSFLTTLFASINTDKKLTSTNHKTTEEQLNSKKYYDNDRYLKSNYFIKQKCILLLLRCKLPIFSRRFLLACIK